MNDAWYDIRAADPGDAAALSALAYRSKSHWGYPPDWLALWSGDLTLTPEYVRMHEGFVATSLDQIVGVCMLEVEAGRAELTHLWIAPEHHRRGVGRRLVGHALRTARLRGATDVRVISDPFAEPFYLQLGARRVGEVAAPMPGAEDRVLPLLEFGGSPAGLPRW